MRRGPARLYNIISLIFAVLTVVWLVFVVIQLGQPPRVQPVSVALPTTVVLPTSTDTLTPTRTFTATATPIPSATFTASAVPSAIPTLANVENTVAAIASPAPTSAAGATQQATSAPADAQVPTGPSATPFVEQRDSPFPFILRGERVVFTTNFANTAGCAWQGIGGQVFDIGDQPLAGIRVHVFNNDLESFTESGSNTLYGQSGFEVAVSSSNLINTVFVELQASDGTIISPTVQVDFTGDCASNVALVNFRQNRPY